MALEDDIAGLSSAPLFSLLNEAALRLIAFAAEHRALEPGDILFGKGERSKGGFVVTSGAVALQDDRGETLFLARTGALIGRAALFTRTTRPVTARAQEKSAVLRISPTLMRRVLQEFPASAEAIRSVLAGDLAELTGGLGAVRGMLVAVDGGKRA